MSLATQELNDNGEIANYSRDDMHLLRETICKGCTPQDFKLFMMVCQRTNLDPFAKQIYAVPRWDSKLNRNSMTIQTSIDGFRLVAERTGRYAPGRATEYQFEQGKLISATSFTKKQTADGTWHEVSYTAFFEEYCQKTKDGRPTKFWHDMPRVMLAKVAEAACLRKCFPMELSQIYTREEMEQAEVVETIDHEEIRNKKTATIHKIAEIPFEQAAPIQIENKVSPDQLFALTDRHAGTDSTYKENISKFILEKYGVKEFADLPERAFTPIMTSMQRNLDFNKAKVAQ
jgi:phage recombination protein Bet